MFISSALLRLKNIKYKEKNKPIIEYWVGNTVLIKKLRQSFTFYS